MNTEQLTNLNLIMTTLRDSMAIILAILALLKFYINYLYARKCEDRFGVPHKYFKFDFLKYIIEISECILLVVSFDIIYFVSIKMEFLSPLYKYGIIFTMTLLYTFIIIGLFKELKNSLNSKSSHGCNFICLLLLCIIISIVPLIVYINYMDYFYVVVLIEFIVSIIFIIWYVKDYINVENKKYEVIELENKKFAILYNLDNKYILIELTEKDNKLKIAKKGLYLIKYDLTSCICEYKKIIDN